MYFQFELIKLLEFNDIKLIYKKSNILIKGVRLLKSTPFIIKDFL